MLIVLISVIVALLYHKITEYVNNRKIDIVIFIISKHVYQSNYWTSDWIY
ncbi:Uncharacterised protein [Streptococcus pneumoniae]|nr:Uncharacterised protein [Streptococcus pneumoniae]CIP58559.1 Uncharacterised protein [Streptococcus pneumoniae]CIP83796.1 Uncharacterised protein [Streptococcus pneumoniae]CJM35826.1 Uncharacterised protein [Streptococcus pneumoniae]CJM73348.1 Uncharacterised protein [Streptococcus pneumoniae]